ADANGSIRCAAHDGKALAPGRDAAEHEPVAVTVAELALDRFDLAHDDTGGVRDRRHARHFNAGVHEPIRGVLRRQIERDELANPSVRDFHARLAYTNTIATLASVARPSAATVGRARASSTHGMPTVIHASSGVHTQRVRSMGFAPAATATSVIEIAPGGSARQSIDTGASSLARTSRRTGVGSDVHVPSGVTNR